MARRSEAALGVGLHRRWRITTSTSPVSQEDFGKEPLWIETQLKTELDRKVRIGWRQEGGRDIVQPMVSESDRN
uniref:Uncharacterized protein n=1 Tax=Oryza brachyantha TaxID=4533 RepID=J3N6Z9_ORYBR